MNKPKKRVHLICNAHLDPVWLWEWQEGAAEAVSTFRTAAEICESYRDFVFNQGDAILYRWVAEYDPALFKRIQTLVQRRKWHVTGGWYLQPDCNMCSGEALTRQILAGHDFFKQHFNVRPTVAFNPDSFGHSRGLVQILKRAGYDAYLITRPQQGYHDAFRWKGFDGSEVLCARVAEGYHSLFGQARAKIEKALENHADEDLILVLWGIGNHGGGPSRRDLEEIEALRAERPDIEFIHSTPENYFAELAKKRDQLPVVSTAVIPFAVGCYTTQTRIKRNYRELENEFFLTEKMATAATAQNFIEYPAVELQEAQRDLLFVQFHDILPGSSIQPVEEASLRLMGHGLHVLSQVKARAFFALCSGLAPARSGEIPILVYNPHPWPLTAIIECEFNLYDQNWNETFTFPRVYRQGREIPAQIEKELSNITLDWRKRIVFQANLPPSQISRFDCHPEVLLAKPGHELRAQKGRIQFSNESMEIEINARTGLIDKYRVAGMDYLKPRSFQPLVIQDDEDPWGMLVDSFRKIAGRFRLLNPQESAEFSGVKKSALPAVRVIESGPVRHVVEAVFGYGQSRLVMRYKLPQRGSEIEIHLRVYWNEQDKALKLSIPTPFSEAEYRGEAVFGVDNLATDGRECVAQRWVGIIDKKSDACVTLINHATYGSDFDKGECRPTLLRSPAYSCYPIPGRDRVPQDRFTPRIDQGEREFTFWLNAGSVKQRLESVAPEAQAHAERPFALSFFPSSETRERTKAFVQLSDTAVQITTMKQTRNGKDLIVRLFEPTGKKRRTTFQLPALGIKQSVSLEPFEIQTLRISTEQRIVQAVNLIEETGNGKG